MGATYVWLIKVHEIRYAGSSYETAILLFQKVFTNKISAINYKISMENKGYYVTLEKYYG